jgi:hypothetical protein
MRCDGMDCGGSIKSPKLVDELKFCYFRVGWWSKKQNEGCCSHNKTAGQKNERKEGLNYAAQHSLVVKRIVTIIKSARYQMEVLPRRS